jgi:hypothetical protein
LNSKLTFESSVPSVNEGFRWAKEQALYYVHNGEDPVGLWYEAALPERNSFCMRDVAHQSAGAAGMGLHLHTKNMFYRFAENIAESRDWCTYWEIHKDNIPTPIDYTNDHDFWYNLPSNFDIIRACYAQYLWTGDRDYIENPVFDNFFKRSVDEYVKAWDKDGDGILEHHPEYDRRGIASYNEVGLKPAFGGDQVAAQYAGYAALASILRLRGEHEAANDLKRKAEALRELYQNSWWNERNGRFYGALLQDRTYLSDFYGEGNFLPLYFGIVADASKRTAALNDLVKTGTWNVEAKTYIPEIFYEYGMIRQAYRELCELMDPSLDRREYPEVSFSVIGAVVTGMMGVSADGTEQISTFSRLSEEMEWAKADEITILGGSIGVEHRGRVETRFVNHGESPVQWKAAFPYDLEYLHLEGERVKAKREIAADGSVRSFLVLEVKACQTRIVKLEG